MNGIYRLPAQELGASPATPNPLTALIVQIDGYAYKDEAGELRGIFDGSIVRAEVWVRQGIPQAWSLETADELRDGKRRP